ncbi:MAG TPA: hypothetical protein VLL07_03895, partial [Pontiella sp.]|nr:hypothetical protein [Pontiella sp.]
MLTSNNTRIRSLLEKTGVIPVPQLETLLTTARQNGTAILEAALTSDPNLKEEVLLEKLGEAMNLPYQRLKSVEVDTAILEKIPTKAVFQYNVIPLSEENGCLNVATSDPFVPGLVDALRLATESRIRFVLSPSDDISTTAKKFYGVG